MFFFFFYSVDIFSRKTAVLGRNDNYYYVFSADVKTFSKKVETLFAAELRTLMRWQILLKTRITNNIGLADTYETIVINYYILYKYKSTDRGKRGEYFDRRKF